MSGARGEFRRFLGIDLGGGRGKTTAVARLDVRPGVPGFAVVEATQRLGHRGTGRVEHAPGLEGPLQDRALMGWLERFVDEDTVVAVDAPLTLPPCLRCALACPGSDVCQVPEVVRLRAGARSEGRAPPRVTPYTQRACELVAGARPGREALGQGTGPVAARAHHLRRALSPRLRLHENLIEVYVTGWLARVLGTSLERRTRQGDAAGVHAARERVLTTLSRGAAFEYVWPEVVLRQHHVFTAVAAAFAAQAWSRAAGGPGEELRGSREAVPTGGAPSSASAPAATPAPAVTWWEAGWIAFPPLPTP